MSFVGDLILTIGGAIYDVVGIIQVVDDAQKIGDANATRAHLAVAHPLGDSDVVRILVLRGKQADEARQILQGSLFIHSFWAVSTNPRKAAKTLERYLQSHPFWYLCHCAVEKAEVDRAFHAEVAVGDTTYDVYYARDGEPLLPPIEDPNKEWEVYVAARRAISSARCLRCGSRPPDFVG